MWASSPTGKRFMLPLGAIPALAEERGKYIVRSWNDDTKKVVETEEDIPTDATPITSETTTLEGGWYVLKSNVEIGSKITVIGIANIILMDGYTLNATHGIKVAEGDVLNIFGQKDDEGTLIATGAISSAGIGVSDKCDGGTVTVYGGTVTALGNRQQSETEGFFASNIMKSLPSDIDRNCKKWYNIFKQVYLDKIIARW